MKTYIFHKNSFAMKLLKGVAFAGILIIAATNPRFGPNMLKALENELKRKKWTSTYQSMNHLSEKKLIKLENLGHGKYKLKLTAEGKKLFDELKMAELKIKTQRKWDGKWRLIMFDVPNTHSKNRLAFTEKLKELGFRMIQKSVWMHVNECRKEIEILKKFYEIERYVVYAIAVELGDYDKNYLSSHMLGKVR